MSRTRARGEGNTGVFTPPLLSLSKASWYIPLILSIPSLLITKFVEAASVLVRERGTMIEARDTA